MKSTKIYVITHKNIEMKLEPGYAFLMVGAQNRENIPEGYLRDCVGENISEKNNSYCELTGLYWMWRNAGEDIIGLVHYRRFFANVKSLFIYRGRYIVGNKKGAYSILNKDEIIQHLQSADIIVKQSEYRRQTNQYLFEKNLGNELWEQREYGVKENEPEYYHEFRLMAEAHQHLNCNMMIGKKQIVDKYCEWLFPLLEKIDLSHEKKAGARYSNREIGYLSEILFGVWLNKNEIKYKICPVVNIDDENAVNGIMTLGHFFVFLCKKVKERIKR